MKGLVMNESEIIWVAGILEGEGNFSFRKTERNKTKGSHRKLRVRLHMTDFDIVNRVKNLVGPNLTIRRDERSKQVFKDGYTRKDAYVLDVSGFRAEKLMNEILPHMGQRRKDQILNALAGWNDRLGPVWTPPTEDELRERQAKANEILSLIGLE